MRLFWMTWALAALVLVGCTARLTPPEVEIETAAPVKIEVGKRGGGFCPPGQRKQGNC